MLGDGATEHRFARGLQLRDAGSEAHPVVAAWCAGGVCNSGGGEPGGRRSSGIQALGVTGHGGRGRWALRVAGVTRNTRRQRAQVEELGSTKLTVHGGGRSSGSAGQLARGRNQVHGVRGREEELTRSRLEQTASSGRHRRQQIDGDDLRWPTRGTAVLATSRGFRRRTAR